MPESPIQRFIRELRRRRVFRVAGTYVGGAFVILEGAQLTLEPLGAPAWVNTVLVVLAILGLPVAVALAWAFDWTPEGIRRELPTDADPSAGGQPTRSDAVARTASTPPRGRATLWVALAGVAVLVIGGGVFAAARRGASPSADPQALAVLPFAVRGGTSVTYLREGLVDLLSRNFDGASNLRSVAPGMVLTATKGDDDPIDPGQGRELAARLGARLFLIGSVYETSGRLRIDASLYDQSDTASQAVGSAQVEGDTTQLFSLVDQLSAKLMATLREGHGAELAQTAAVTTRSLPALKAYLTGEQSLRAAHYDSAMAGFQRAVDLDTTFALAYYRLAVAASARNRPALAHRAAERAVALSDHLGDRERRLLLAFDAPLHGRMGEGERRYRELLRDYPGDMEAAYQMAEMLVVAAPAQGRSLDEARQLLRKVLEDDPKFICPI